MLIVARISECQARAIHAELYKLHTIILLHQIYILLYYLC